MAVPADLRRGGRRRVERTGRAVPRMTINQGERKAAPLGRKVALLGGSVENYGPPDGVVLFFKAAVRVEDAQLATANAAA